MERKWIILLEMNMTRLFRRPGLRLLKENRRSYKRFVQFQGSRRIHIWSGRYDGGCQSRQGIHFLSLNNLEVVTLHRRNMRQLFGLQRQEVLGGIAGMWSDENRTGCKDWLTDSRSEKGRYLNHVNHQSIMLDKKRAFHLLGQHQQQTAWWISWYGREALAKDIHGICLESEASLQGNRLNRLSSDQLDADENAIWACFWRRILKRRATNLMRTRGRLYEAGLTTRSTDYVPRWFGNGLKNRSGTVYKDL